MMPLLRVGSQKPEYRLSASCILYFAFCLLIIGSLVGCAPKITRIDDGKRGKIKIEYIYVERVHDGNVVTIKSSGNSKPISFTAFKLTAPLRLIIQIPDVAPEMYKEPIDVGDGMIRSVHTGLYGDKSGIIGRIEIEMDEGTEYDMEPRGNVLTVRFREEKDASRRIIRVKGTLDKPRIIFIIPRAGLWTEDISGKSFIPDILRPVYPKILIKSNYSGE